MGTLNLLHAKDGDSFKVLSELRGVKATVIAHKKLAVFSGCSNLYECHVFGADSAFMPTTTHNAQNLRACSALDVNYAFNEADEVEGCIARNAQGAFNYANTRNCLAEKTREAFRGGSHKSDTALNVRNAFFRSRATDCIAEHCTFAFTSFEDYSSCEYIRCESRNPKLLGINFDPHYRISQKHHRQDTKITGRIVGKGAKKLRRAYRERA